MVKSETKTGEKQEYEKRFEELKKICDKQEDRLQDLQATAFQLANYYFVFQGVILTAICNGATSLKFSDRWFLFIVSLLAALLNLVALIIKGLEYVRIIEQQDQNWSDCSKLQKFLQNRTTNTADPRDTTATTTTDHHDTTTTTTGQPNTTSKTTDHRPAAAAAADDDDDVDDDPFTKSVRYCSFFGCMALFIAFAVITLVGCWLFVGRKDDCGFVNKKDECIKLCQGTKCIRICNAS